MNTVIEQWNNAAERYSDFESTSEYAAFCRRFISETFTDLKDLQILDTGCGNGVYTNILAQNGGEVRGFDGSEEMIRIAKTNFPACHFDVADMTKVLPYVNEQFDMVICNLVLMDIEPIDKAIDELYRITKREGIFFFSIVHPAFYNGKWETDERGKIISKNITRYLTPFAEVQTAWNETTHFHRPISFYLNKMAAKGFLLQEMFEPKVYEETKIPDIPLYLFVKFKK